MPWLANPTGSVGMGIPGDESLRGVQHSKIVLIDRCAALVTSANFTQAAQSKNIEAGFLTRDLHQVERIAD